jgi:hypothetical protein
MTGFANYSLVFLDCLHVILDSSLSTGKKTKEAKVAWHGSAAASKTRLGRLHGSHALCSSNPGGAEALPIITNVAYPMINNPQFHHK